MGKLKSTWKKVTREPCVSYMEILSDEGRPKYKLYSDEGELLGTFRFELELKDVAVARARHILKYKAPAAYVEDYEARLAHLQSLMNGE